MLPEGRPREGGREGRKQKRKLCESRGRVPERAELQGKKTVRKKVKIAMHTMNKIDKKLFDVSKKPMAAESAKRVQEE